MNPTTLPVAVIGAGPIGLAAAAHLHERGIPFVVFEVGDDVAASIREWAHVQLFSPWSYNVDPAARRLLEATGWTAPPDDEYPTGRQLIERYLEPLTLLPEIASALRTSRLVTGITRAGTDKITTPGRSETPFVITTDGPFGPERTVARAVIDATGTWLTPNPIGADGRAAIGEHSAGDIIEVGIPDVLGRDRRRYAKSRVVVVGSGHSAQNAVRDLAVLAESTPGTEVTWIVRRSAPGEMFGGKSNDQLPERGRLGADAQHVVDSGVVQLVTGFRTDRLVNGPDGATLVAADGREVGPFDRIVNATGFRPDLEMLSELRVDVDPVLQSASALAPMIDPNVHSCGSVPPHGAAELAHPEHGLYIVGAKSYGRAPTFLLATGYEQVRSVVAELAGDSTAASDVQLILPETGVCSLDRTPAGTSVVDTTATGWGSPTLRRATLTLAVAQLVSWGVLFYGFAVAAPEIVCDTGWSTGVVAGAFSVGMLIAGLGAPMAAHALVRFDPRLLLTTGSLVGMVGMLAFAAAPNPSALYLAWIVIGAAMAATLYEPAMAVLVNLDPARRHRTLTVLTVAGGLASTAFAPIAGWLVETVGWRQALAVLGVAGGVVTAVLHAVVLPAPSLRRNEDHVAHVSAQFSDKSLRLMRDAVMFEQAAMIATTTYVVSMLVDRGIDLEIASATLGVMGLGKVTGRLLVLGSIGRCSLTTLATVCTAIQLVGLALQIGVSSTSVLLAAMFVVGSASGVTTLLRPLITFELVGAGRFAATNASIHRAATLARAASPLMLGVAAATVGWPAGWASCLFVFALAAERYARLGRSVRRSTRATPVTTITASTALGSTTHAHPPCSNLASIHSSSFNEYGRRSKAQRTAR